MGGNTNSKTAWTIIDMNLQNNGRDRIIVLCDGPEVLTEGNEEEDDEDVKMQTNNADPAKVDGGCSEMD